MIDTSKPSANIKIGWLRSMEEFTRSGHYASIADFLEAVVDERDLLRHELILVKKKLAEARKQLAPLAAQALVEEMERNKNKVAAELVALGEEFIDGMAKEKN